MHRKNGTVSAKRMVGAHHAPGELALWNLERAVKPGREPRIKKLLLCAILIEERIRSGEIPDQATAALKFHVSEMTLSELLRLIQLAPDIIDDILYLPMVTTGSDPIRMRMLRPISREWAWEKQRQMWRALKQKQGVGEITKPALLSR